MIKAIGIAGSPRRNGNSTTLLEQALHGSAKAGAETELINLNELSFRGCQGCVRCAPQGECVVRDDLIPVFAAIRLADVWIVSSPIYRDGLSGQFKSFFDRCCWMEAEENQVSGKRRAAVIVSYMDKEREDYRKIAETVPFYLSWMGDFGPPEVMTAPELGPPGDAAARPELLQKAEALGEKLVRELTIVRGGE